MHELDDFKVTNGHDFRLKDMPCSLDVDKDKRDEVEAKTAEVQAEIAELQDEFYADGREGIVVVLQAMDAAGKDGTIKHVMSGMNPQGVSVTSFKQPSSRELAHDYLWRAHMALPARGMIGVYNRSYYEDVLVVDVHDLYRGYKMPERCIGMDDREFFKRRYEQISAYEDYLWWNGYRTIKIFLNLSKAEQRERFLARIDEAEKNWKFSSADVKERGFWDDYQKTYERVIAETASEHAPWYVLPADQKWVTRYYVSLAIRDVLKSCKSEYPVLAEEERERLAASKEALLAEQA